jgi:hypothetical protein
MASASIGRYLQIPYYLIGMNLRQTAGLYGHNRSHAMSSKFGVVADIRTGVRMQRAGTSSHRMIFDLWRIYHDIRQFEPPRMTRVTAASTITSPRLRERKDLPVASAHLSLLCGVTISRIVAVLRKGGKHHNRRISGLQPRATIRQLEKNENAPRF